MTQVPFIDPSTAAAEFSALLNADRERTLRELGRDSGRVVLNADDLFMRYPPYRREPALRMILGPILYAIARDFTNWAFARLLAEPAEEGSTVVFTAGGGASGKSTVLRAQSDRTDVAFVVDTTFSDPVRAAAQVEAALASGRNVEVNYVYRRFEHAVRGMLRRAQDPKVGRVVPVGDLARTHRGAQISSTLLRTKYIGDPRFRIRFWKLVEGGALVPISLSQLQRRVHPPVDVLCQRGQDIINGIHQGKDANWTGESLSDALRDAAQGQSAQEESGR